MNEWEWGLALRERGSHPEYDTAGLCYYPGAEANIFRIYLIKGVFPEDYNSRNCTNSILVRQDVRPCLDLDRWIISKNSSKDPKVIYFLRVSGLFYLHQVLPFFPKKSPFPMVRM